LKSGARSDAIAISLDGLEDDAYADRTSFVVKSQMAKAAVDND